MARKKKAPVEEQAPRRWAELSPGEQSDVVIDMLISGTPLPEVSSALHVSIRALNRAILSLGPELDEAIEEAEEAAQVRARAMIPAAIAAARPSTAAPKTWAELVSARDAKLQAELNRPGLTPEEERNIMARLDRQRWKLEAGLRP